MVCHRKEGNRGNRILSIMDIKRLVIGESTSEEVERSIEERAK